MQARTDLVRVRPLPYPQDDDAALGGSFAVPHTERVLHPYDDMVDIESVERVEDRVYLW
jgi:hypothetical protein